MAKKCKMKDGSVGYIIDVRQPDGTLKSKCDKNPKTVHVKAGGVEKSVTEGRGSVKIMTDSKGNRIKCGKDASGNQKYKWKGLTASGKGIEMCKTI